PSAGRRSVPCGAPWMMVRHSAEGRKVVSPDVVDVYGGPGGDRLDGRERDGQGGVCVVTGGVRGTPGADRVGEVGQFGDVGVLKEVLVVRGAVGGDAVGAVGGEMGAADVSHREHAVRAENLAADVVAVHRLEV